MAVKAFCSIPTVKKWLRREPIRGVCLARIERAAQTMGLFDKPKAVEP